MVPPGFLSQKGRRGENSGYRGGSPPTVAKPVQPSKSCRRSRSRDFLRITQWKSTIMGISWQNQQGVFHAQHSKENNLLPQMGFWWWTVDPWHSFADQAPGQLREITANDAWSSWTSTMAVSDEWKSDSIQDVVKLTRHNPLLVEKNKL